MYLKRAFCLQLFSIKVIDIVKCLGNLTDCLLYVDDFCIYYCSKRMETIERQLQQNLNKIEKLGTKQWLFSTAGDWDCVVALERLPALHYSVDFIFLSFGIMGFIVEL